MSDSEDRIHPATAARQQQCWREGDFAKSYELASAIQLLGGLLVAAALFGTLAVWLKSVIRQVYSVPLFSTEQISTDLIPKLQSLLYSSAPVVGSIGVLLMMVAVISHWCQTGVVVLGNKLSPDVHRLSPGHWFFRLFSFSSFVSTLICVPKILLTLVVVFGGCWLYRDSFFELGSLPVDQLGGAIFALALMICAQAAIVLLIGSAIDYWMKYLAYSSRIQMTDQELRDETRMQTRKSRRR
jgi:flagellar biosynthesis protein FlhB